ncbi:hypothetical protein D187_004785 [Cystobacter fuscus DSM 2262]|uniref:Uncharacterized protein n=2 Tax=Cystobacter fuscus TaxID=43 RepID=S9P3D0_CYSF2|nr:hypothetical protein D187_004785 [Cystobacter fuscus DSM 2262]
MLLSVFFILVLLLVGFFYWSGRTAIVVLNETGCGLDVLSVNLNGLECSFRNALFGWQGVLLLRADGSLGVAEMPR